MATTDLYSSTATIQIGAAKADGKLSLTTTYLQFEPFNKQLPLGPYQFARSNIINAEKCLGKGAGFLPLTTDAFRVTFQDGKTIEFIVADAQSWLKQLSQK
ncbi:hypothetical protein ACFOEE_15625 [Pseudoalteromonas fenneropenaei]|uniref:Uncharacterized protein n=1 Tax=Pseudoalteromonas fenneropenaei TaxID=1737459 RepID=A0ABV7CN40_9GAMM